jgi:PGF-CTERM protein
MTRSSHLVLVAVALVALAGVGGAAAPNAEFDGSEYEASQSGTVTITVTVNDTDTAALRVGSESAGYTLHATLVDENGDGEVSAEFRVPNAGTDSRTLAAVGSDTVENVSESEFHDPPLAPGAYRLTVSATGEQPSDVGRLTVEATRTTALTTTYAPTDDDTPETTTAAETTTAPTTDDASDGGSPGFGVAAGLVGLLGAALLAARR